MRKLLTILLILMAGLSFGQIKGYRVWSTNTLEADNDFIWQGDTIKHDSIAYVENAIDSIRVKTINGAWSSWIKTNDENKVDSVTGTSPITSTKTSQKVYNIAINAATDTTAGSMSSDDKALIDSLKSGTLPVAKTTEGFYNANVQYGALYNWYAATDPRNIAPIGWHVPTVDEVITLLTFCNGGVYDYGQIQLQGGKLKETGLTYWDSPNTGATNEFGFNARASGIRRSDNGLYDNLKTDFRIWLIDGAFNSSLILNWFNINSVIAGGVYSDKSGLALRFIKDDSTPVSTVLGNDNKIYNCVTMGSQIWMSENSNETRYQNGDYVHGFDNGVYTPISNVNWAALTAEGMSYYSDLESNGGSKTLITTSIALGDTIDLSSFATKIALGDSIQYVRDNYVPYTGATDTLNMGTQQIKTDAIEFNLTPSITSTTGTLSWNDTDKTLDLDMGDVTQQLGQEMPLPAYNNTGVEIPEGTVVYISGRQGHLPEISPARSDSESTSVVFGVTTTTFGTVGEAKNGHVTVIGYVRQIKTNYSGTGIWGDTWVTNDKLYVSKTVAGQLTNIEPSIPHHSDVVGTVGIVGAAGIGSIFVVNNKHTTLQELTDVNGTPLTTSGQFPVWNQDSLYFDFTSYVDDFIFNQDTATQNANFWIDGKARADSAHFGGVTNFTRFETDGTIVFNGAATVFDEVQFELNAAKQIGVNFKPDYDLVNFTYDFPQNDTTEIMGTAEEIPHWYKSGSTGYFMVHFDQTQNLTPVFRVQYKIYNSGDAVPANWSLAESNGLASTYTSGTIGNIITFTGTSLTNIHMGATIKVKLYRKDNVYTGDCKVTRFGLHLEKDTEGSRTQYGK